MIRKEITREIRKYILKNDNERKGIKKLGVAKAVHGRKFIAFNTFLRKDEKLKIDGHIFQLKGKQIKPKEKK